MLLDVNSKNSRLSKFLKILMFSIIFIYFFIWFTEMHPMFFIHGDDWDNVIISRKGIPFPFIWNPGKVFPETAMAFITDIGMYCIYPFTKDIFFSLQLVYGITMAIFITLMSYMLYSYFCDKFDLNRLVIYIVVLIFLALHFLIFKTTNSDRVLSDHLFNTNVPSTYFHYVIPNIFNTFFAIYIFKIDNLQSEFNKNGTFFICFFVFFAYLALFSSIFSSIIFAGAVLVKLVLDMFSAKKNSNGSFKDFLKAHYIEIIIIFVFVFANILEMTGKRAKDTNLTTGCENNIASLISFIPITINKFVLSTHKINLVFLSFYIITFIVAIILLVIKKDKTNFINIFKWYVLCFVVFSYLVLLCSKVNPEYLGQTRVNYAFYVLLLIPICYMLLYIFQSISFTKYFVIILFFVVLTFTDQADVSFDDTNIYLPKTQKLILEDMYEQFKIADEDTSKPFILHIPSDYNYLNPISIEYFFNKYGLLKHNVRISGIVKDEEVNKRLKLYR